MEKVKKNLEEVVAAIKNSKEYQNCVRIKKQMNDNPLICEKINKIKKLQKEVVKSGYDKDKKKELDLLVEELESIPIYVVYTQNLEIVNQKIDYVRDSLNDYFKELFEKDTNI